MTIKELRKEKGLTQVQFGESLGVTQKTIAAYETDRLAISAKVAARILEVYGVEVEAISVKKPAGKAEKKTSAAKAPAKKATKGTDAGELPEKKTAEKGRKAPDGQLPKASVPKPEIYIQSPLGGNITPQEVVRKVPADAEAVYVRVDQNTIWWVRGDEYGAVEIWRDDR